MFEWLRLMLTFSLLELETLAMLLAFLSIIAGMSFLIVPITIILEGIFLEEIVAAEFPRGIGGAPR